MTRQALDTFAETLLIITLRVQPLTPGPSSEASWHKGENPHIPLTSFLCKALHPWAPPSVSGVCAFVCASVCVCAIVFVCVRVCIYVCMCAHMSRRGIPCTGSIPWQNGGNESGADCSSRCLLGARRPGSVLPIPLQVRPVMRGLIFVPLSLSPDMAGLCWQILCPPLRWA